MIVLSSAYLRLSAPIGRRGFKRFMGIMNRLFPARSQVRHTVSFPKGQKFGFMTGDPYWLFYALSGEPYEPEISQILARIPTPSLFLDCGANFGYWSIINSERMRTVAVEASSETLGWLKKNQQDNANAFEVVHAAITDGSLPFVAFSIGGNSAGRHISDTAERTEKIPTVTIDELVHKYSDSNGGLILVKLDVEGFEVDALNGAHETLKGNSVFVYEDHGKDSSCAPTAYLLNKGRSVFAITPKGAFRPVLSVDDARKIKTRPYIGYNFLTFGDAASMDWLK